MKLSSKILSAVALACWIPQIQGARLRRINASIRSSNSTRQDEGLYDETGRNLQGNSNRNRCTLLVSVKQFEDQDEKWQAECEMSDGMYIVSWSEAYVQELVKSNKLKSGESELDLTGLRVTQGNIRAAQNTNNIKNNKNNNGNGNRRKLLTAGTKTMLVVRVVAPDKSTTATVAQLSDDVFGTSGDLVNLKSQYAACSYNQLNFIPAVATGVTNGVRQVTITQSVTGVADAVVRDAITTALGGGKPSYTDYAMYCLPPGTSGGWIAYAYINSWMSVYNDQWCQYLSGQMHEVGHNLGLAHSNENGNSYEDQSGMMGYSYSQDDGPLMCFNAYKSWQLGWYSSKAIQLNAADEQSFSGALSGVVDYNSASTVVIRLNTPSSTDYYINFNRKTGFNSGTVEGGNQVLVVTAVGDGTVYAETNLVAKLNAGGSYTFAGVTASGGDMVLRVNSIGTTANIDISPARCSSNTDCPSTWSCNVSTGKCIAPCSGTFGLAITKDNYPGETTWDLKQNGLTLKSGDASGMSPTPMGVSCAPLTFTIYDSYGDGICCGYGSGSYSASWNSVVFGSGGQFTTSASHTVSVSSPTPTPPAPTPAQPTTKPTSAPTPNPTPNPTKAPTPNPTPAPTLAPAPPCQCQNAPRRTQCTNYCGINSCSWIATSKNSGSCV